MAYTPGLKRKELVLVRKIRQLPISGEVTLKIGDIVNPETVVARALIPGDPVMVNAGPMLGIESEDEDIRPYLLKKEGESIKKGELFAMKKSFFGLSKRSCYSPIDGVIERVSELTGKILMRNHPIPVDVKAYIPGKISSILPSTGAIVETPATFIQGIFGVGGETHGKIMLIAKSPKEPLTTDAIDDECAGKILVAGAAPSLEALRKAVEVGAKGIISGGVDQKALAEFIGYELGVVITGHEETRITLIVTEGFGEKMTMAYDTFRLLEKSEGVEASINGATQIRAGVIRPEIIIPRMDVKSEKLVQYDAEDTEALSAGLHPGVPIRIIAAPYFGALAHVVGLPPELRVVETESEVRVLTAELADGQHVVVPRANVEIIGE